MTIPSRDRPAPPQFREQAEKQAAESRQARKGEWSWVGNCSTTCKLNPEKLLSHDAMVKRMFTEGEPDRVIAARLRDMGYDVAYASVQRHRVNHLYKADWHGRSNAHPHPARPAAPPEPTDMESIEDVDNLLALRRIIALGMKRLPSSKITADLVVKAIELEERLTKGNRTDALMEAIQGAFDDLPGDGEGESPMDAASRLAAGSDEHSDS